MTLIQFCRLRNAETGEFPVHLTGCGVYWLSVRRSKLDSMFSDVNSAKVILSIVLEFLYK